MYNIFTVTRKHPGHQFPPCNFAETASLSRYLRKIRYFSQSIFSNFLNRIQYSNFYRLQRQFLSSIWYKSNFLQDLDQASFSIFPKKRWFLNPNPTRTKKLKPKNRPEPDAGLCSLHKKF